MLEQRAQQYYLNAMGMPLWRLRVHKQEIDVCNHLIPAGIVNYDSQAIQPQSHSQPPEPDTGRFIHTLEDAVVDIKSQAKIPSEAIKPASLPTNESTIITAKADQELVNKQLNAAAIVSPIVSQSEKIQSQQSQTIQVDSDVAESGLKQLNTQKWFQLLSKEISSCSLCVNRIGGKLSLKTQQLTVAQNTAKNLFLLVETPSAREYIQGQYISEEYQALLTSIFQAMNLNTNIYISSVLKCSSIKPSHSIDKEVNNQEINNCSAFFKQELDNINPDLIVTLGPINMQEIAEGLEDNLDLEQLINQSFYLKQSLNNQSLKNKKAIPIIATLHPAFLYRNPLFKAKALQQWMRIKKYIEND